MLNLVPSSSSTLNPPPGPTASFEHETATALSAVRRALAAFVTAIPGAGKRPADLQKALDVDYKLCWQLFNVIRSNDGLSAAKHVPGMPSLKTLLSKAERYNISPAVVANLQAAFLQFDEVVRKHAGDRAAFAGMVAAIRAQSDDTDDDYIDIIHRRNAYRAESQIWGRQMETYYVASVIRPLREWSTPEDPRYENMILNAKLGFRRLRPNVSPVVNGIRLHPEGVQEPIAPLDESIDKRHGGLLLPQFSTQPLPKLQVTDSEDGFSWIKLVGEGIGRRSEVDLAFGWFVKNVNTFPDTEGRRVFAAFVSSFQTPAALCIKDLLVHRPSMGVVSPGALVHAASPTIRNMVSAQQAEQLPVRTEIEPLGALPELLPIPEAPRIGEMLNYALPQVGWDPSEFDVYRLKIPYPVVGSQIRIYFPV